MAISGDNIDGIKALRIGLVDCAGKPAEFDREVEAPTQRYLDLSSEGARSESL